MHQSKSGFTIVELLIVIVVIAILATLAIVSYGLVSDRASISAGKSFDASLRRSLSFKSVAAINFSEGSGSSAADSSGQGNNAVVNGSWTTGMEGGAVRANNNGTGATITNPIYFDSESFTVSAWVNSSDQDGSQSRILGVTFSPLGYLWLNFGNGRPYIEVRDSTNASWSTGPVATNISGKWAHVAAVIDREKSIASVYINGKLEAKTGTISSAGIFGDNTTAANSFRIGYQTSSATLSLDGIIDDVYVYKSALNLSRIEQLYKDGAYRHLARR